MFLCGWCAIKEAGVAWVIVEVDTSPVASPSSSAASNMVFKGVWLTSTAIAPLYVLVPVESAVPPAAESVMYLFADCVFENPMCLQFSRNSFPLLAPNPENTWVTPMPSPIRKITFLGFSDLNC